MKIRKATEGDVSLIVKMLSDDKLGALRENYQEPLPSSYIEAFKQISNDPNQYLMVVESDTGEIIGTMQLSFIQYLTYEGGIRAQIEAVRVRKDQRGKKIGEALFNWAIQQAKKNGAHVIQLTTDKKREEAKRFYERLGFTATHEGMKMHFK